MIYYRQTDKDEVEAMAKQLTNDGFIPSISTGNATIKRETSKYNKYMKWHVEIIHTETGSKASNHFKTKKEAVEYINQPHRPCPVGSNRMLLSYIKITE